MQLSGRLLRAIALVREHPSLTLFDIALDCGFHDHGAFTHAFTERFHMTPSQLRAAPLVFYESARPSAPVRKIQATSGKLR